MRSFRWLIIGVMLLSFAGMGVWRFSLWSDGGIEGIVRSPYPELKVEFTSVVGLERTGGEATAWNNTAKLAVDSNIGLHVVYDYSLEGPDLLRYAYSKDGQVWELEEWTGRYPAITVDDRDRIYIAYVERVPGEDRLVLKRRDGAWQKRLLIQAEPRSLFYPALAAGPDALHLAWESHTLGDHRINYLTFPLQPEFKTAAFSTEEVTSNPEGLYFATITLDNGGRAFLAWQAARDPVSHRIDAAVRSDHLGWELYPDISSGAEDARHPTLGLDPDGTVRVAYIIHEGGFQSSLHTLVYNHEKAEWERTQFLVRQLPEAKAAYAQKILAFPTISGGYVLWGHTVPAACGVGPLFWAPITNPIPQELLGEFASYPHLVERPQGVLHLVWTDRDTEEKRAFVVRYARLSLASREEFAQD